MTSRRYYPSLLMILFGIGLLTGCGGTPTPQAQGHASPQLVVAENTEPTTLNPIFGSTLADVNAESGIFNSLVSFTPQGGFQGSLAKNWSVSSNHKIWTFYLRKGVLWQDGKPFSAKDVVFTFRVDTNPATAATAVPPIIANQVESVTSSGPLTVTITLKHTLPSSLFLQAVSYVRIVPEHILGKIPPNKLSSDTAFARHPIGTGPLKLVKWVQGNYLEFKANSHYFLGPPHISSVVMDIIPSPTTAIAQLESGAVDLIDSSNPITPTQFTAAEKHPNIKGYTNSTLSWKNITLVEQGLFKDVYVRQALDYATPKNQLIHTILGGYGVPAYYSQPTHSWQGTTTGIHTYPYNLSKARKLLIHHGFSLVNGVMTKNGEPLNVTLYASATDPENSLIARVIQSDWQKIGVHVTIRLMDPNAMLAAGGPLYSKSGLNAFLLSWVQGPDPESDAYHWLSTNSVLINPAGGNYARYNNPTVDHLLTEGATTFSRKARAPLYHEVDRILSAQVPDIFLWWSDSLTLANNKLIGYDPNAYAFATFWNFQNWRWK
ncbi:MAG: hypothetical protein C7B47_11775 [Sulfobacillus thermosulfidooxidans]|uniref:Solute-binding protein family 5 domain-containing protein n=1 Tax=Sulfobacillus thermosulfidooxidans TaxID=28034 RepID=A0A2T2WTJ7_SULTH|nr:MAG: hypothetical protein C7B47_11775 [Sulfobacillus thermosulfidooxidans]